MIDRNDPRLTAYVLGELDDSERELIEQSLTGSSELRREVEAIRRGADLIEKSLLSEPVAGLSDEQKVSLRAAAEAFGTRAHRPSRRRFSWLAITSCLAILVAGSVGAILLMNMELVPSAQTVSQTRPSQEARKQTISSVVKEALKPSESDAAGDIALSDGSVRQHSLIHAESEVDPPFVRNARGPVNPAVVRPRPSDLIAKDPQPGKQDPTNRLSGMPGGAMPGMGMPKEIGGQDSMSGGYPGMGGYGVPKGKAGQMGMSIDVPFDTVRTMIGDEVINGEHKFIPEIQQRRQELFTEIDKQRIVEGGDRKEFRDVQQAISNIHKSIKPNTWDESGNRAAPVASSNPAARLSTVEAAQDPRGDKASDKRSTSSTSARAENAPGTWRRARATPNASRLMIGDRDELAIQGMQANILVDGFRARLLLDLYYFNHLDQRLEGNFQLRLPDDASLYYFAFGESAYEYRPQVDQLASKGFLSAELARASGLDPGGILRVREGSWTNVKEARVVAREKAALAYSETVRRRVDPALVEWSGAGVFNARVFPLMPNKLHRIVVGYDITLQAAGDDLTYRLELPENLPQCQVDLNVSALPGISAEVSPPSKPFTSGGRAYYHFSKPAERHIELRLEKVGPMLLAGDDGQSQQKFFAARMVPELPADAAQAGSPRAVFVLDTSLSSRPDKFNVWLNMLENVLARNRDGIQEFAVLFFNIESQWWKEGFTANTEDNVRQLLADCHALSLEGATDLKQAIAEATAPSWRTDKTGTTRPDVFLLSDGAATWGELNIRRVGGVLKSNGGTLFAYKSGLTGTASEALEHLARESGGAVFSVVNETEIAAAATAHRVRPWKLLDVSLPGGSDALVAGRPQYIYPGQSLLVVGRGAPDATATLRVARGDDQRTIEIRIDHAIPSELAARVYGQVAVGQLEDLGRNLEDVAVAYARHFRVTGQTCSLLMLESDADYQRFHIKPEDDAFVVRSTPSSELIVRKLDELAEQLTDAKSAVLAWLGKLEGTPGLQFRLPTALRVAIERLPREAFEVEPPRLVCRQHDRTGIPKEFLAKLESGELDYDAVSAEAARRQGSLGATDGLKVLSCLVENNPGDPVLARDVAFSALEWGLGGSAYSPLQRAVWMRPYEPQSYQALAQCLAGLGNTDLAMIYYEVAFGGTWNSRYHDVNRIVGVEYLQMLRRIEAGQLPCRASDYAHARLASLQEQLSLDRADLVVMMMWNTDRTDVDLHVVEPTGEECFYSHPRTQLGGQITADVTEGYGPEMYLLPRANQGEYKILAHYFGSDSNRTQVRSKVYVTIYEHFGDAKRERVTKRTIVLSGQKEKRDLAVVKIKK